MSQHARQQTRDRSVGESHGAGSAPTVLVADDERALRGLRREWLVRDDGDWAVEAVADGSQALAALDGSVDLAVLDRRMGSVSGAEVHDRLDETGFDGAVVIVSALQPDERLPREAVDAYIQKPVSRERFVRTLDDLVDRSGGP